MQFLYIALSSAAEVDIQLLISENLNFIKREERILLSDELTEISKMLQGLIRTIKNKI